MEKSIRESTINQHAVLLFMAVSVALIIVASQFYPGGSLIDKHSVGFDWSKNFISNLFEAKAINGQENPARIWAIVGMVFQSFGYGIFFIRMSKKIPSKAVSKTLKSIGVANMILIFLIATPLHDLGTLSILLTLLGLFIITVFVLRSKLHLLKIGCVFCLLTFYCFFFFFGFGNLIWAALLQKVYNLSAILLAIALGYCSKAEDFKPFVSKQKEK